MDYNSLYQADELDKWHLIYSSDINGEQFIEYDVRPSIHGISKIF